jgi:hypothetical protein
MLWPVIWAHLHSRLHHFSDANDLDNSYDQSDFDRWLLSYVNWNRYCKSVESMWRRGLDWRNCLYQPLCLYVSKRLVLAVRINSLYYGKRRIGRSLAREGTDAWEWRFQGIELLKRAAVHRSISSILTVHSSWIFEHMPLLSCLTCGFWLMVANLSPERCPALKAPSGACSRLFARHCGVELRSLS